MRMIRWSDGSTSHEGLVIGPERTVEVRVMSDVWENQHEVRVWDPTEGKPTWIALSISGGMGRRTGEVVSVDIEGAHRAAFREHERLVEDSEAANKVLESILGKRTRQENARKALLDDYSRGDRVIAVRGRKPKRGTVGVVTWTGGGDYGPRVGILPEGSSPDAKPMYGPAGNVERILEGLEPGQIPEGGWCAHLLELEKASRKADLPKRGMEVTTPRGLGIIFWTDGDRIGVDTRPPKERKGRCEDPWWGSISESTRADGTPFGGRVPVVAKPAPPVSAPFDRVTEIHYKGFGKWVGVDKKGKRICSLTENGVRKLAIRVPAIGLSIKRG
jgi:hypothetical protein